MSNVSEFLDLLVAHRCHLHVKSVCSPCCPTPDQINNMSMVVPVHANRIDVPALQYEERE